MLFLNDKIYYETKDLILGKREKSLLLVEFSDWIQSTFSVELLNFQLDNVPYTNRLRLWMIMKNTSDWQTIRNPYYWVNRPPEPVPSEQKISQEFGALALRHEFTHPSKLKDVLVVCNDFSEEAKYEAHEKAGKEIRTRIELEFPMIWRVRGLLTHSAIFYELDADVLKYELNGTSNRITDTYYSILKQYDDLNYFTRENISLIFDSKENFDKNYEGNMFYYSRDH